MAATDRIKINGTDYMIQDSALAINTCNNIEDVTKAHYHVWKRGQIKTNTTPVSIIPEASEIMACCVAECRQGDQFKVVASGAKTTHRPWAFLDSSKNVITGYIAGQNSANIILTAPENAAYLVCNSAMANFHILKSGFIGADMKFIDKNVSVIESSNYTPVFFDTSEFSVGSISSSDGREITSSTRIRTNDFYPLNDSYLLDISLTSGYKLAIAYYSTNDGSGFISVSSFYSASVSLDSFPTDTVCCKFIIADIDDSSSITVNDCTKVSIEYKKKIIDMLVSGTALPKYWRDYLDNKLPALQSNDAALGRDGVSFAFITDIHVRYNAGWSPAILEYIIKNTNVKTVVCGGDIIGLYDTKTKAIEELKKWMQKTSGLKIINLLGNHDLNNDGQTGADITKDEFYSLECRQSESFVTFAPGGLYGYSDNESQKIRFIYLDSNAPLDSQMEPDYTNNKGHGPQMTWMKQRILELESGWTVVIFSHRFFKSDNGLEAKSAGHITAALTQLYSENTVNATIACIIVGHRHINYKTELTYQTASSTTVTIPVIASSCDAYNRTASDPSDSDRSLGNTSEQCFDLYYINTNQKTITITRIGAGDTTYDRSYTY